ncbi:MAG: hypothetical protein DRO88_12390 [Promethearchaeia archaeon]|nr:MAG: hypothetical protein DRO88_12390 [Candidatus Lokiarchaeia archaeon]
MEQIKPYFQVSTEINAINLKIQRILDKYMLGVFIARKGGDILYSKQFQSENTININLMSNFISALSMFGEENIGDIKRIFVEGLNITMNIVSKHDLILTILFRPDMTTDFLDEEIHKGLDMFYEEFSAQIENCRTNQAIYQKFDDKMAILIHSYLVRINAL